MSRPLRIEFPGAFYHVTSRGNARQAVFRDDADRERFLFLLGRTVRQQGWLCHAYCLMTNHFHLLVETPGANLSRGMQQLNATYSQGHNRRHGRVGHLFQGRYTGIVVEKEAYLLELSRYIVLNPVRARMVRCVADWPWSSFGATVGSIPPPLWLEVDWLLGQFGRTREAAQAAYRRFVREGHEARSSFADLRGQMWLGGKGFRQRMRNLLEGAPPPGIPQSRCAPNRPTVGEVLTAVCEAAGVTEEQLIRREAQDAYQVAAYLLRRRSNLGLKEVAGIFDVSASRISNIQRVFEHGILGRPLARILERCKV